MFKIAKYLVKTTFAAICFAVVGISGMRTYTASNQFGTNMLLAENVEALSGDIEPHTECDAPADPKACWADNNPSDFRGMSWSQTKKVNTYGQCLCMGASRSCPAGSSTR